MQNEKNIFLQKTKVGTCNFKLHRFHAKMVECNRIFLIFPSVDMICIPKQMQKE